MRELNVFVNNKEYGQLTQENQKYIFTYPTDATSLVSVTMLLRRESWNDTRLHLIFQMNLPEGALKEAIQKSFGKLKVMDAIGFLEVI